MSKYYTGGGKHEMSSKHFSASDAQHACRWHCSLTPGDFAEYDYSTAQSSLICIFPIAYDHFFQTPLLQHHFFSEGLPRIPLNMPPTPPGDFMSSQLCLRSLCSSLPRRAMRPLNIPPWEDADDCKNRDQQRESQIDHSQRNARSAMDVPFFFLQLHWQ